MSSPLISLSLWVYVLYMYSPVWMWVGGVLEERAQNSPSLIEAAWVINVFKIHSNYMVYNYKYK